MRSNPQRGYNLIEMLVALAIVAVLATAGVAFIGSRQPLAVRALMDDLEGAVMGAQKAAVATGRDMSLVTQGTWDGATPTRLISQESRPSPTADALKEMLEAGARESGAFTFSASNPVHRGAGVVVKGATWWGTATQGLEKIEEVEPFKSAANFNGLLKNEGANLFSGGTARESVISGASKRFTETFFIQIVSLQGGAPLQGGPAGVLVVQNNGTNVYRFYNPGVRSGDGKWRRI